MLDVDLLICGAGPVGCTVANRAAHYLGWRVLLVEKRSHIAGNCYDETQSGILTHRYGPHYFRTNSDDLLNFLSAYTEWTPGNYIVKTSVDGKLYPFPINLDTLEQFFKRPFTPGEAARFLERLAESYPNGPQNSEEVVLNKVGRELYEAFFKEYTKKQWGCDPRELAPSVCGRIPLRLNRDPRYVDHKHQVTPKDGFTKLFQRMIHHENIQVMLNADFREVRKAFKPKHATLCTGPIDEYFNHRLGPLPWRSLKFDFIEYRREFLQPCVQINYPNDHEYTRTVEIKHVTKQKAPNTVISYEYPSAIGEPFYPIPSPISAKLFEEYKELGEQETRNHSVYFAGRLANYCYINTDQAIEQALSIFETIRKDCIG